MTIRFPWDARGWLRYLTHGESVLATIEWFIRSIAEFYSFLCSLLGIGETSIGEFDLYDLRGLFIGNHLSRLQDFQGRTARCN